MTLEEFVKSVCDKFPQDPTQPSLVLSYLAEKGTYYASVVRYSQRFGGGKFRVCSADGLTLEAALGSVSVQLEGL